MRLLRNPNRFVACGLPAIFAGAGMAANVAVGAETDESGFIEKIVVTR